MDHFENEFFHPPFPRKRRESQPGPNSTLVIGNCDSGDDIDSLVEQFQAVWTRKMDRLTVEFRNVNEMGSNAALLLYSLLRQKPPNTRIIANALSPLLGAGIIVWLAADIRTIRPTAWLYFRKAPKPRRKFRPWLPDEEDWRTAAEPDDAPDFRAIFHNQVVEIIDEYLPINEFANKIIVPCVLAEWGLLAPEQRNSESISPRSERPATPGENY